MALSNFLPNQGAAGTQAAAAQTSPLQGFSDQRPAAFQAGPQGAQTPPPAQSPLARIGAPQTTIQAQPAQISTQRTSDRSGSPDAAILGAGDPNVLGALTLEGIGPGSEDSDAFDILGLGLDAKRDIRAFLGLEAQEDIGRALGDVNKLLQQGMQEIGLSAEEARQAIETGRLSASDFLAAGFQGAQGFITQGQQQALSQISSKFGQAQTALGQGRQDIQAGTGAATAGLEQFSAPGATALEQFQAASTPQGFAQNIESLRAGGALDPLIQARTQQLQSAQGAAGLTRSGAGLTELAQVPEETLLGIESLLTGRQQQVGAQGLTAQQQIAQLQATGGVGQAGIQQNIAQLLQQQGQLGAGIQTGAATTLADLIAQQGTGLAGIQTGAAGQQAGISTGRGQDIASLLGAQAQAQLEAATAASEARAQGLGNVADIGGQIIGGFSDKRLKKNIKKVGEINGVNIYSFEPNELGEKIGMNMNFGVIADEVEEIYPDLIGSRNGFKTVNYPELLKRIA
ncbi:MAG: tail fiber domain-containing protein [Candidatus Bathyarchaeia archaeon]